MITGGGSESTSHPCPQHPLPNAYLPISIAKGGNPAVIVSTFSWVSGDKLQIHKSKGKGVVMNEGGAVACLAFTLY